MVGYRHETFQFVHRQVDEQQQQQQTVAFKQHIRKIFIEEYNQTRGKGVDEALNERTSVIPDTDYYRSGRINSLLGYNDTEADKDGENKESESDNDID